MGSVLGALAVAEHGTQSITTTPEQFRARYLQAFGAELP
jgi:hypothetical protein